MNYSQNAIADALNSAKKRNKDAFKVIAAMTGISENRIKEIANGAEPEYMEDVILSIHM